MDLPLTPTVGEIIEKGQQSAINTVKIAVSDTSSSVQDQLGIKNETNTQPQIQNQQANPAETPASNSQVSLEEAERTKEMVREYYAPDQASLNTKAELEEQERQRKLTETRQKLRQELHNEVYFNDILNAGASIGQESRPQDAIEEEGKQKKMEDLQVAQQETADLAKFRAQRQVEIKGDVVG